MYRNNQKQIQLPCNIGEVLKNKTSRCRYTFHYEHSGESYYLVNGIKVPVNEFNEMFPVELIKPINIKGENPDGTRKWMK